MKGCLTALAKLIGGYWYFENKTLYLFVTPPGISPDPIDDTPGRFLHDPQIAWAIDKSQVRTRVYGKGASTRIAAALEAGAGSIPVENAEMFNAAGGLAIAGVTPDGAAFRGADLYRRAARRRRRPGRAGRGAVGGAGRYRCWWAPGSSRGLHGYALNVRHGALGESMPSPIASILVGVTPSPTTAPIPGTPTPRRRGRCRHV